MPFDAMWALASATVNSPKWKIDAARTASALPWMAPSTRSSRVPAPPLAMTGRSQASLTARVSSLDDIEALTSLAAGGRRLAGVIVGKALYEGAFTVEEAMAACAACA